MAKANKSSRTVIFNATQAGIRENAQSFCAADTGTLADLVIPFTAMFDASNFGIDVTNAAGKTKKDFASKCVVSAAELVEEFATRRACWVKAYDESQGVVGGAKRFAEIFALTGLKKPQSEKALKTQAVRAAAKELAGDTIDAAKATVKDGAGEAAVATTKMELSKIELHIITLLRAGKFEMAAECVASLADVAAPF